MLCRISRVIACPSCCHCPQAGLGTWRHAAVLSSSDVLAVPKSVPLAVAATLTSGASTALRLLSDFSSLASGDVVVQGGGESAVGEAVVQLAAKRGVKTVTFVKVRGTGAVLLVGVAFHLETLWGVLCIGADSSDWMIYRRGLQGERVLWHGHSMPRLCGARRRAFPPSASLATPCTLSIADAWLLSYVVGLVPSRLFRSPSLFLFLPDSTGKCGVHHDC